MSEDAVDRFIRESEASGRILRDQPEPKKPGLDIVGTIKEIEKQGTPRLNLSHIHKGDHIKLITGVKNPDGTIQQAEGEFLVTTPARPRIEDPRGCRQAKLQYISGNVLHPDYAGTHLRVAGASFGGSSLWTATVLEGALVEYYLPNDKTYTPNHTMPVIGFDVLRERGGQYVPVPEEERSGFEIKEDINMRRLNEVVRLFDTVDRVVPAPEGRGETFEISANGEDFVFIPKEKDKPTEKIIIFDYTSLSSIEINKIIGAYQGEVIYHIDVYEGVSPEEYKSLPFLEHPLNIPHKKRYSYNVSNGDLDGSACIKLRPEDVEVVGLQHGPAVTFDRDGTTEVSSITLNRPSSNSVEAIKEAIWQTEQIAKEFIVPETRQDSFVVRAGEKEISIPKEVNLPQIRAAIERAFNWKSFQ